ncbi:MAG TPA: hypothetical protein VNX26_03925 [Candidatus Acidoferrum sp.]|jgi:hypothetical protein|nr:hypothetical protein [Candidatus Acidoferrum sp.]
MRLFAAFALASLLSLPLSSSGAQDKSKPESQQREAERQPSNPAPAPAPTAPTVEINIGTPSSTGVSETHKENPRAEARPFITGGEGIIAVITAIYASISYFSLRAIKRQALSAEAQLAAESPWIMVNIEYSPGMKGRFLGTSKVRDEPETHHTDFIFRFDCINHGRTPALITEKRATLKIIPKNSLPPKPDLKATEVFDDRAEPLAAGKESLTKRDEHFSAPGYQGLDEWVVLYGVVRYRDVFGRDRQTTFGYEVTLGEKIERLPGSYWKYNENT